MLVRGAIGLLLAILLGYGVLKAYPLLSGPRFSIDSPAAYATIENGLVSVSGTVRHGETLTLNGALLLIDERGRFHETLSLPSGNAILRLSARDRFGRTTTVERTVFVPEE